ncbi:hypothetical protein EAE91_01860 [Photorhabdus noenieputensis]|uniref:hypothetical protein n=1 Tax=Photorhabdus noenieputensis TaxID=1208607 RepID=UPI001BD43D49|nr:hypothetical protein [Photorhabdus noenieputensis]MBS9435969.1 hypothetical protein [Photorhabdus noenieputensis]MCK3667468.1 hypothetical protein [Photorhabdus noenieputensis]
MKPEHQTNPQKGTIYIAPNQTIEIDSHSNIVLPLPVYNAVITNRGPAPVRVSFYWAAPFGEYQLYNYIDVIYGESKILYAPPNALYSYRITAANFTFTQGANIEFRWIMGS